MRSALVIVDLIRPCSVGRARGSDDSIVLAAIERSFDGPRTGYDLIVSVGVPRDRAGSAGRAHRGYRCDDSFELEARSVPRSAFAAANSDGWLLGSYLSLHDIRAVDIVGAAPLAFLVESALDCAYRFFSTRLLVDRHSGPAGLGVEAKRLDVAGVGLVPVAGELADVA